MLNNTETSHKLIMLMEYRKQAKELDGAMISEITKVITDELAKQIDDIKAEFAPMLKTINENIARLEAEVKAEVVAAGERLAIEGATVTYVKGKESWDGKLLKGYAVAHPEIKEALKIGKPYAFITFEEQSDDPKSS